MAKSKSVHYQDDLAYIHDAGYGGFARAAAKSLLALMKAQGITRGLVVDLGCGSGIWAEALARAGYDVVGYDLSVAMIEIASRRVPSAAFHAESFVTAKLPRCACVTAMGEIFNYLHDPRNTDRALFKLFRRIHRALEPGGLLVFDGAEPGRGGKTGETRHFTVGDDWACMSAAKEDRTRRTLRRDITTFRREGAAYRRGQETHLLRLFDRPAIVSELRKLGFRVRTFGRYGELRFPTGYVGVMAKKPR